MSWAKDDGLLRALYPKMPNNKIAQVMGRSYLSIKNRATKLGLQKDAEYMQKGPGQFESGQKPWNTGISYQAGGRSAETQFKKGSRPHTWLPMGTERVTKDDLLERKISETGTRRWRTVHSLIWEEHNGPKPKGHLIVFIDGNKRNFDPANLECISRSENMSRNTIHNLPPEIAAATQLIGALNRQINKRDTGARA